MSKIFLKNIGKNIRNLRNTHKLSQENLAEMVGVSRNTISSIELGKSNAPILTLYKIFKVLDMDLNNYFKS